MRSRRAIITIEVESVLTKREMEQLAFLAFGATVAERTTIRREQPKKLIGHDCRGEVIQVQVNIVK